jgi:carbon-monoxide dehydrogenase medium subunit
MYSPAFDYYRADSLNEIGDLLRQHPGAKILAGGHSLIPLLKLRLAAPSALVDIGRVTELKGISMVNGSLRIGAMTTHAEIAASPEVRRHAPALAEAAGLVGDPAVRNRGTIGGNAAHADPASDLPIALSALDARFVVLTSSGTQEFAFADFCLGMMTTVMGDHDVLMAVDVPVKPAGRRMAYVKFEHPASRYAVIGVATALAVDGQTCTGAAVAIGGLVPRPVRAAAVEHALVGQQLSAATIAGAAERVSMGLGDEILGDLYASADYRKAIAPVYVKRALAAAVDRAQ